VGAFWVAVLGYAASRPDRSFSTRFVLGLGSGAILARLGWVALHPPLAPEIARGAWLALGSGSGLTLLPVPLGLLLTAPWRAPPPARSAYLAASLGSLPLALAVARLGCLAAGCCHGTPTDVPWGFRAGGSPGPVHPTPLYEIAGWIALWLVTRRVPRAWVPSLVLIGFGALRWILEPWRAQPPQHPLAPPPSTIAAAWIAVGCLLYPLARPASRPLHLAPARAGGSSPGTR
jgi:prolipoprotein diacylglyceryltransferase